MPQTLLAQLLSLSSRPVAITFVDKAPAGVPRVTASEPAGCGYWRRAAGEVFYTIADDHKHCPVGAHTHYVALSPAESVHATEVRNRNDSALTSPSQHPYEHRAGAAIA
jgi:hypothetical protein